MESLKQAVHMVKPICYLSSIDIEDASYSVPIHSVHKKYLKFMWVGQSYQYNVMPNGFVGAPKLFTKIFKPIFAYLREQRYTSVMKVDDSPVNMTLSLTDEKNNRMKKLALDLLRTGCSVRMVARFIGTLTAS